MLSRARRSYHLPSASDEPSCPADRSHPFWCRCDKQRAALTASLPCKNARSTCKLRTTRPESTLSCGHLQPQDSGVPQPGSLEALCQRGTRQPADVDLCTALLHLVGGGGWGAISVHEGSRLHAMLILQNSAEVRGFASRLSHWNRRQA